MPSDGVMGLHDCCRVCGKEVKSLNHFAEKHVDTTGRPCRGSDWHTVRTANITRGVGLEKKA